ncbi:MAG: phage integrase family protein [Thaumarchaeota archaeon]|nr:phage integrase family protein [Nitrososphaerota archaeon]
MTLLNRSLTNPNDKSTPMSEISIHDRVERFLDRKFRTSRSFATKETYKGGLNKFKDFAYQDYNQDLDKFLDNMLNNVLDPIEALDNFYTYLTKIPNPFSKRIGYSNATIRQYVITAKEFLNDIGCKIYSEDIRRKFKLPRQITMHTEGLTKEIIAQILRLANYKLATVILIACSSGMRIGEIAQLKLSDVDFATNPTTIAIRAETTKTREARLTHISKEATQALKDYLAKSKTAKNNDYIFLFNHETKLDLLNEEEKTRRRVRATIHNFENQLNHVIADIPELNKRAENMRFQVHFHAFRYFFKTQVTDAHESDFAEALMGHKSIKLLYYRQNAKKRLKTYLDVEHALTIAETEHIERNYSELQLDNQQLREQLNSLGAKFRDLEKRFEVLNPQS